MDNCPGVVNLKTLKDSDVRLRSDPKDAKNQQLVFFDDWERPEDRLKGTIAILRRLAGIAEQAKAA